MYNTNMLSVTSKEGTHVILHFFLYEVADKMRVYVSEL